MNKSDRLMEILSEIQELYPNLDKVLIDDVENPEIIRITSEEVMLEIMELSGLDPDDIEVVATQDIDDEDPSGGVLQ